MKNRILRPLEKFLRIEASSGIILAISAALAMLLANGFWSEEYFNLLKMPILGMTFQHWINDGLMVIFFFVIGMELKKEILSGELSHLKSALLPITAALGGMFVPAFIYFLFNQSNAASVSGWGIPMATDIAFALAILGLFGARVPFALKIFLLALAIVDDLGAILVIALFYTQEIRIEGLALAAVMVGGIALLKKYGVKSYAIYVAVGIVVWFGVLYSGVHATIAGVLLGLLTPTKFKVSPSYQVEYSPLDQLVSFLHPWVSFCIMPIFAFANAGISLEGLNFDKLLSHPVYTGIFWGLFAGKALGIFVFSRALVLFGWGKLPPGVSWGQILGVGFLGGVGFTMALFISNLALASDIETYSKAGIMLGSLCSAAVGSLILGWSLKSKARSSIASGGG